MLLTIGDLIAAINSLRNYDEKRKCYQEAVAHLHSASNAMREAIEALQKPGLAEHIVFPEDFEELITALDIEGSKP